MTETLTIDPRWIIPVEEMVVVTNTGAEWLTSPQEAWVLIPSNGGG